MIYTFSLPSLSSSGDLENTYKQLISAHWCEKSWSIYNQNIFYMVDVEALLGFLSVWCLVI